MSEDIRDRYLCDSEFEGYRLEMKTSREEVLRHLALSGIEEGVRILDLGCGTGAISRIIVDRYRPELICSLDLSLKRLRYGKALAMEKGKDRINFINGDCFRLPFKEETFDFVWSRFLFQLIPNVDTVLEEVKRVTKTGGRITFAELDGNGFFHYPVDKEMEELTARILESLNMAGFDHLMGRKLFHFFKKAGLQEISVNLVPYQVVTGRADDIVLENWRMKLKIIEPILEKLLKDKETISLFKKRVLSHLESDETLSYNILFITTGTVIR